MTNSGPSTGATSTHSHPSYAATPPPSSCGSAAECSLSSTLATLSSQHPSYAFANLSSTNKLSTTSADSTSHLSQILNVPSSSPSIVVESSTSNNLTLPLSPNDHVCVLVVNTNRTLPLSRLDSIAFVLASIDEHHHAQRLVVHAQLECGGAQTPARFEYSISIS